MRVDSFQTLWEQSLFNFLFEKGVITENTKNNYGIVKKAIKNSFQIDLDTYTEIKDMRNLVNAIKHGNGSSYREFKLDHGNKTFADSVFIKVEDENGEIIRALPKKVDLNTLTSEVLEIGNKVQVYYDAIEKMWMDLSDKRNNCTEYENS